MLHISTMNDLWLKQQIILLFYFEEEKEQAGHSLLLAIFTLLSFASSRFMIVINARYIFLAPMSQLEIFSLQILCCQKRHPRWLWHYGGRHQGAPPTFLPSFLKLSSFNKSQCHVYIPNIETHDMLHYRTSTFLF